ncbi:MAG: site-2 protease family protein [Chloroflexota bacterium]|nr:site-2 protease family protein [Chloroflexota bacterium]
MDFFGRRDPDQILALLLAFVVAITIHEFMHAWTAWYLGDDTAQRLGRITLNPIAHLDPIGTIGLLLIAFGFFGFGWGKPVPVNPNRLRPLGRLGQKGSMALVAFAGPLSNVAQAAVVAIPLRLAGRDIYELGQLGTFLGSFILVNVLLAAFNMIPVPPLDGHKILTGILPHFWYPILAPMERYGFMLLFVLILVGGAVGGSIIGGMISPVQDLLVAILGLDQIL